MIAVAHGYGEGHGRDASDKDGRYKCSRNGNRWVAALLSKVNGPVEARVDKVGIHQPCQKYNNVGGPSRGILEFGPY